MLRFSFKRLCNVIRLESVLTLWRLPKTFGVLVLLSFLSFWSGKHGTGEMTEITERLLFLTFSITYVYVYHLIDKSTTRILWLMYPSGKAEKFLAHAGYSAFIVTVLGALAILTGDGLQYALHALTGVGHEPEFFTPYLLRDFGTMMTQGASAALFFSLLFFYNSVFLFTAQVFNKNRFLFTMLSLLGVTLATVVVFRVVNDSYSILAPLDGLQVVVVCLFLLPFTLINYAMAYASFRDEQLVKSGTVNW